MVLREGSGFTAVDQTGDPSFYIHFLDMVNSWPFYQQQKARSLALLDPRSGQRILDVGCGLGDVTRMLAAQVGPGGGAVGLDASATMLAEARRRSEGLSVEFIAGNAEQLDFPAQCFDACRADRVLLYLHHPERVLAEMARVVRPGGRVVIADVDKETVVVAGADKALTRTILNFWCDSYASGWIGRDLPGLFRTLGFTDVVVEPMVVMLTEYAAMRDVFQFPLVVEQAWQAKRISKEDGERWLQALEAADQDGRFLMANTVFLVAGRKGVK
ncbi:MAG: methyltransferase domain-containing protein [Gemmataceae bacterium]|nr:methyltransferase domain-containing protein [Gemmataceae bacterium]